jgi:tetratricopeptide (TPR) repeat protein
MEASEAATLVDFVREAEERVLGPEGGEWGERLARRFDDLALAAAALLDAGDDEAALRLVGSLSRGAQSVGRVAEARALVESVLRRATGAVPEGVRARALLTRGELAFRQGDQAPAGEATAAALDAALAARDASLAARAHMNLARIAFRDGDAERIAEHAERMLELDGEDASTKAGAVHMLGWAAHTRGDLTGALARFEENVENYRVAGNEAGAAAELANIGDLALEAGDDERAASSLREALTLAAKSDSRYLLPSLLASVAVLAGTRGRYADCLELAAAADAQYGAAGLVPDPGGGVGAGLRAAAVAAVGGDEADLLAARGAAMPLDHAVALAGNVLEAG